MYRVNNSCVLRPACMFIKINDENTICTEKGKGNACQNCIRCVYAVLHKYNLHSSAYSHLYIVYKFVLTLFCTQVRYETTFSKLKYI